MSTQQKQTFLTIWFAVGFYLVATDVVFGAEHAPLLMFVTMLGTLVAMAMIHQGKYTNGD